MGISDLLALIMASQQMGATPQTTDRYSAVLNPETHRFDTTINPLTLGTNATVQDYLRNKANPPSEVSGVGGFMSYATPAMQAISKILPLIAQGSKTLPPAPASSTSGRGSDFTLPAGLFPSRGNFQSIIAHYLLGR